MKIQIRRRRNPFHPSKEEGESTDLPLPPLLPHLETDLKILGASSPERLN